MPFIDIITLAPDRFAHAQAVTKYDCSLMIVSWHRWHHIPAQRFLLFVTCLYMCIRCGCEWKSQDKFRSQFWLALWVLGLELSLISLLSKQLYPLSHLTRISSKTEVWGKMSWAPWNMCEIHDTAVDLKPSLGTMNMSMCNIHTYLRQVHTVYSRLVLTSLSFCLSLLSSPKISDVLHLA